MGIRIRKHGTVIAQFASAQQVDISHTSDSIQVGDGTNLLGPMTNIGGTYALPVDVQAVPATLATSANQTNGTQRTKVTDGTDNVEIEDVGGEKALKVAVISTVGGGAAPAHQDDTGFVIGTDNITVIGAIADETAADSVDEGDAGGLRMTLDRLLKIQVAGVASGVAIPITDNASTISIDDGGGAITVDGTVAATQSGTWNITDISGTISLPTGAATSAKQDTIIGHVDGIEALLTTIDADTSNLAAMLTSLQTLDNAISGNEMQVDVITMPTVTVQDGGGALSVDDNGGSLTVDGTVTASGVTGAAAHDAAVSGNPVRIAGRAMLANGTAVAEDDTADIATDNQGRLVVTPLAPRDLVTHATGSQSTTTEATMLAAGGAGVFHDVTKLIFTNSSSSTAAQVQIRDATAGTIRLEMIIAPQGGAVIDFGNVPMCQTTANNNWTIDLNAAVSTVYWYIQAVKRIA